MKKSHLCILLLAILVLPQFSFAKNLELNFQDTFGPTHALTKKFTKPWVDKINEEAKGKMTIHLLGTGAIVEVTEAGNALRNGVLDLASAGMPEGSGGEYHVFNYPGTAISSVQQTKNFYRVYNELPEVKSIIDNYGVVMYAIGSAPLAFISTKAPIRSINDIKGKRVIIPAPTYAEEVKSLGGTPVTVSMNDVYVALQRGMGDILYAGILTAQSFKLNEIAKYITPLPVGISLMSTYMNKELYNDLTDEQRAIIDANRGFEVSLQASQAMDDSVEEALIFLESAGLEVITMSSEATAEFNNAFINGMGDWWIDYMIQNKAKNPQELVKKLQAISIETAN